ncbi:hypothetical protein GCM10018966_064460 [Streptomyces yanii]
MPTGEKISWDLVWLGVGVTSVTDTAVLVPPKVAFQLAANAGILPGSMYTWVVSYWGPTAMEELLEAVFSGVPVEVGTA